MADKLTDQRTKHWTGIGAIASQSGQSGRQPRIASWVPIRVRLPALPQTKLQVLPTHTRYEFEGAGIRLSLAFLNPSLPDSLEMVSRPVTYLTWSAQSLDAKTTACRFISMLRTNFR